MSLERGNIGGVAAAALLLLLAAVVVSGQDTVELVCNNSTLAGGVYKRGSTVAAFEDDALCFQWSSPTSLLSLAVNQTRGSVILYADVLRYDYSPLSDSRVRLATAQLPAPAWPDPHFRWSLVGDGEVHIASCANESHCAVDRPLAGKGGHLELKSRQTVAYCVDEREPISPQHRWHSSVAAPAAGCGPIHTGSIGTTLVVVRGQCLSATGCDYSVGVQRMCRPGFERRGEICEACGSSNASTTPRQQLFLPQVDDSSDGGRAWERDQMATCTFSENTCPPGTFSSTPQTYSSGATSGPACQPCDWPYFSVAGASACEYTRETCPAGTYADLQRPACVACSLGTYSNGGAGQQSPSACTACGLGRFSTERGSTSESDCKACPYDTYSDVKATGSCKACPAGKMTMQQASSSPNNEDKNGCVDSCQPGEHFTSLMECLPCKDPSWCSGTTKCFAHRTGDGCISCIDGYYADTNSLCQECPKDSTVQIIVLCVVIVLVLSIFFLFVGTMKPETSLSSVTILINHIQFQRYILSFNLSWPPEFVWVMRFLASLVTLSLPEVVPAPECQFKWDVVSKWLASMMTLPFVLSLVWVPVPLAFIATMLMGRRCGRQCFTRQLFSLEKKAIHKSIAVSVLVLNGMFGYIVPRAFDMLDCSPRKTSHGYTEERFLDTEPSVQCTSTHTALGVTFFFLYAVGIPVALMALLFWARRHRQLWKEESWVPTHFGWLYLRFEHKFFFWELISMLIKTILGVGAKITSTDTVAQIALSLVVLSFALMLQVVYRPYESMSLRLTPKVATMHFTIRGSRRDHGIHFKGREGQLPGYEVASVDTDVRWPPQDDDFRHNLAPFDVVTHIDGMALPHIRTRRRRLSFFHHHVKSASSGKSYPPLVLADMRKYVERAGRDGVRLTVERELRFHGANADGKLGKWSAEDMLAALLIGFSIFTIILGVISPDQYDNAYESAQDAREALEAGDTNAAKQHTEGAGPIAILVFLFLMLAAAILLTIALLVRTHARVLKRQCSKKCSKTDLRGQVPKAKVAPQTTEDEVMIALIKRIRDIQDNDDGDEKGEMAAAAGGDAGAGKENEDFGLI